MLITRLRRSHLPSWQPRFHMRCPPPRLPSTYPLTIEPILSPWPNIRSTPNSTHIPPATITARHTPPQVPHHTQLRRRTHHPQNRHLILFRHEDSLFQKMASRTVLNQPIGARQRTIHRLDQVMRPSIRTLPRPHHGIRRMAPYSNKSQYTIHTTILCQRAHHNHRVSFPMMGGCPKVSCVKI
jgi:hypothetical protein